MHEPEPGEAAARSVVPVPEILDLELDLELDLSLPESDGLSPTLLGRMGDSLEKAGGTAADKRSSRGGLVLPAGSKLSPKAQAVVDQARDQLAKARRSST